MGFENHFVISISKPRLNFSDTKKQYELLLTKCNKIHKKKWVHLSNFHFDRAQHSLQMPKGLFMIYGTCILILLKFHMKSAK